MRVLVVEDEPDLNRQLVKALGDAGYAVDSAKDGEDGYFLGDTEPYDVVILDLGLPKMDGISILEQWRRAEKKFPVIILTARDRWSDKVAGMDAGADDYLAKPFHMEELLARVRAQLRRSTGHAKAEIECGLLRLDTKTARVSYDGQAIKLTSHEYRLLAYLMHHRERVVSRTELVEHLYDQDFDRDSNTIEVFIGRLRKKIPGEVITTVRGLGYNSAWKPMRLDSLAFRLFATAVLWTLVALPLAGLIIFSLYRQEVDSSFDDRLRTLLLVVYTDSSDHAQGEPGSPRDVGEPLFEITHSGWYWQIKPTAGAEGRRTLVSKSLATETLASPYEKKLPPDAFGIRWTRDVGPNGTPIRVAEMIQALGGDESGPRYSYLVAGPLEWPQTRVTGFRTRLVVALSLVGFGLMALTLFQVRFGLLPLREIEKGLGAIRTGQATRLDSKLPVEIEPLQVEINALIQSNQDIIERARTQVGNLAHALKTPLAVITNEAREEKSPLAAKVQEQAHLMRDQIGYYLDRAQMAARADVIGRITEVLPVAQSMKRTLERINRDKGIEILVECPETIRFQGEKQDLEEMLGNLTDNACKWAASTVHITAKALPGEGRSGRQRLVLTVEDDGPGLTPEQRQRIGKRGQRLDESKPGSGLGLSIVSDIATSYTGRFSLDASPHGGLLVRLELPAV